MIVSILVMWVFVIGMDVDKTLPLKSYGVTPVDDRAVSNVMAKDGNATSSLSGEVFSPLNRVAKVVDGDTIAILRDGNPITLRLIGINTPETVDPRRLVECFGREASARAKEVLGGKSIRLELDPSQGELDKYGRTLAYVFLGDGTNFNLAMIREGYAYEYTYHIPYKYQAEFKEAQNLARNERRGLWASGVCGEKNVSTPIATSSTADGVASPNYACNKNIYDCKSFTSQKEAQSVFDACGGSANDVHKLDSDKDGVVCEGLP